jgi:hypothetical protein
LVRDQICPDLYEQGVGGPYLGWAIGTKVAVTAMPISFAGRYAIAALAGKILGVEAAQRMPDQDHGRAEVQRLQQLVEVASRRLGSDWRGGSGALWP